MKKYITLILLSLSFTASAKDIIIRPLEGSMFIWGEHLSPSHPLEGFSVFIKGENAKVLYNKIPGKGAINNCYGDGTLSKYSGNLECNLSTKGIYSCNVGIGVKDGKVYRGEPC